MQIVLSIKQKIIVAIVGLNILIAFFVFSIINQEQKLMVFFFDIGQGSSIFIQTPNRVQVLIDGGPESLLVLEYLSQKMPFWDRHIDIVVSTHSSADHLTGLIEALSRYKISKVIWTGMHTDSLTHYKFQEKLNIAEQRGAETIIAQFGQKFHLGQEIYFKILNPLVRLDGVDPISHNNNSIVIRLTFNEIAFLFTSDIEQERETLLVQKQEYLEQDFLSADILKVPHHGSNTSSGVEFLQTVGPDIAIIQVGEDNRYNHPHQDVINRLKEKEIDIFRTDLDGTIKIISDGENYEIIISAEVQPR